MSKNIEDSVDHIIINCTDYRPEYMLYMTSSLNILFANNNLKTRSQMTDGNFEMFVLKHEKPRVIQIIEELFSQGGTGAHAYAAAS